MKRQMIKSFLIGICITALGGALFLLDLLIFPDTGNQTMTFCEDCLLLIVKIVWWPATAVGWLVPNLGDTACTLLLVATAFFWGTIVQCFAQERMKARDSKEIFKS